MPSPGTVGLRPAADGFPWPWSVCRRVAGSHPIVGQLTDPLGLARDLAGFITARHAIDPADGPAAVRGGPLAAQDQDVRTALAELTGLIAVRTATMAWAQALRLPDDAGPAQWFHGDLSRFNILTTGGRLGGAIDVGCMGVGDLSLDLIPAANLLTAPARERFRNALGVDNDGWARGRGQALSISVAVLPHYQHSNPPLAGNARHSISEVLADFARTTTFGRHDSTMRCTLKAIDKNCPNAAS